MAQRRLMSELEALQKERWVHIEVDSANLFYWNIGLMVVNSESVWNGGYYRAQITFHTDYPYRPPFFRFTTPNMLHPNIYTNGQVCISILHNPGDDELSGESASERWSPLQGVDSVLRSILLLLDSPEINSPANVDASVMYRDNTEEYNRLARAVAAKSRQSMPSTITFPTEDELIVKPESQKMEMDESFWNDDDGDSYGSTSDFGFDDEDD